MKQSLKKTVYAFAAVACLFILQSCETDAPVEDDGISDLPWSQQSSGMEGARFGNFPQSR